MDEFFHEAGVARHDDDEVVPMILHVFQQDLHRLVAEVVSALLAGEGIGLVDEEHAAHGAVDDLLGLDGGLSHIARHQSGAVGLHELPLGQHADGVIQPGQQPRHRGLAGARVAHKYQMQAHGGNRQAVLLPQSAHLDQVDETAHVLLHCLQTAQRVQLRQQILHILRLRSLLLRRLCRLCLSLRRLGRGRLFLLRTGQIVRGAAGGVLACGLLECAHTGVGVGDLVRVYAAVHCGKEHKEKGAQLNELVRVVPSGAPICPYQVGEKTWGSEDWRIVHGHH